MEERFTEEDFKTMMVPVIKVEKEKLGKLCKIKLSDILHWYSDSKTKSLIFETHNGTYRHIDSLDDVYTHLLSFGVREVYRGHFVNMEKVKAYDTINNELYFEEPPIGKNAISIGLNKESKSLVRALLGPSRDVAYKR